MSFANTKLVNKDNSGELQNTEFDNLNSKSEINKSMQLKKLINDHILEIIKEHTNKYSSGVDRIPRNIIRYIINEIVEPICYIVKNSIKYIIFPDNLKTVLIKPIYETRNRDVYKTYRPTNILPALSKIFEQAVCKQVRNFWLIIIT